jgi:hypothetical protein
MAPKSTALIVRQVRQLYDPSKPRAAKQPKAILTLIRNKDLATHSQNVTPERTFDNHLQ